MKAGSPFPHPPPPPSPTGSCQSLASSSRKSREPPCEPGRAGSAPAPAGTPRPGARQPPRLPHPALLGLLPSREERQSVPNGRALSRPPGAGLMPPGMSSPCWWAPRRGSSLSALMRGRGVTPQLGASLRMASCGVVVVVVATHGCPLPRGREDTRVRATCVHTMCLYTCVCPLPLPLLPRWGWVAHPEPVPPSPFPSPDCLSEYRKNKLCRWLPASQKHLMSRSA